MTEAQITALRAAIIKAIEAYGLDEFKKLSMFASNRMRRDSQRGAGEV